MQNLSKCVCVFSFRISYISFILQRVNIHIRSAENGSQAHATMHSSLCNCAMQCDSSMTFGTFSKIASFFCSCIANASKCVCVVRYVVKSIFLQDFHLFYCHRLLISGSRHLQSEEHIFDKLNVFYALYLCLYSIKFKFSKVHLMCLDLRAKLLLSFNLLV